MVDNAKDKKTFYDKQPQLLKKEPSKLREHFQKGMTAFIVIVAGVLFFFTFLRFSDISKFLDKIGDVLKPITYGFVIAFLLNPVMKRVESFVKPWLKKWIKNEKSINNTSRTIGVFSSLLIGIALITLLLNMVIPEVYNSIKELVVTLPGQISDWIDELNVVSANANNTTVQQIFNEVLLRGSEALEKWVQTDLLKQTNVVMTSVTTGVLNVVNTLMDLLVGLMTSIYVLYSKERFMGQSKKIIYAFVESKRANTVIHICKKAHEIFNGFIIGKIIDSAIIGVLCFVGMSILKLPYVLLISVIVGVTNVIPVFGPYIGAVPGIILIFLTSPIQGLYFAIFILLLQQLDGNVIGPTILGDSTGLSPFWVIFSIVVGGGLFGVFGMLIGVPTFALIYYIIRMLVNQKLEHKQLPVETGFYTDSSYVDDEGSYVAISEEKKEEEHAD